MTEQVPPQIAGDANEGEARDPARDPPEETVGGNERHEDDECQPYAAGVGRADRKTIDQVLDAVLRAHRTGNGGNNGSKYDQMCSQSLANIAQHERDRTTRIF